MSKPRQRRVRGDLPIWTCPVCRALYVPEKGKRGSRPQKTCRKPACIYLHKQNACRRVPVESMEAKRVQRVSALMDQLRAEFGKLTTRDIQIARIVYEQAARVGYQRGIHARRKSDDGQAVAA